MKKALLFTLTFIVLVVSFSVHGHAWQGRMGGMEDPYGLVEDESDFLIHPSKIAKGEGVKFYGDYRFNYTDVTSWDYRLNMYNTAGAFLASFDNDTSGDEYKHNTTVGAAFPLVGGRMGLFFSYDGMSGDYDGKEDAFATNNFAEYDLSKDYDNFALRLLYGRTVGVADVGLELGMAYKDERQKARWNQTDNSVGSQNYFWSLSMPERSLLPLMIPYDSRYWEFFCKAGTEVKLAPLTIGLSIRGGTILSSDNDYKYLYQTPVGTNYYNVDMDGNVRDWHIGSDIWMRFPGGGGLSFPVLFSIDYASKKRNGDGIGTSIYDLGISYDYTHKEQTLNLKVGGGVEKKFGGTALLAAGVYYNYQQARDDFRVYRNDSGTSDHNDFPFSREHRIILNLAGEKELSSVVALRTGFEFFHGWVRQDFKYSRSDLSGTPIYIDDISLNDGSHWGIGASIGGTIKVKPVTLEPFINGGWQKLDLDGNGERSIGGTTASLWKMDNKREEWHIGGGLSIKFN